ncbi:MAG TPA: M24 family metallopeptidase [Geobacteraceae bacterium]
MEPDVPIVIDYTGIFNGYLVDMTRIFVLGKLASELEEAFTVSLAIQRYLAENLKPGIICEELFLKAASMAEEAGLGNNFMGAPGENARFVGHGVGLELDELPILAQGFKAPLQAGQTIAIEPKFVFPGQGVIGNMQKPLSKATAGDFEQLLVRVQTIHGCASAQEAAQRFIDTVYETFCESLVLLRLFITVSYDRLPEKDRLFVNGRGRDTNTSHLIHGATPVFTLLGTRGKRPEWDHRRNSQHFRCIPLASTVFVSSLSMLSRQFESVGFDLGLIDTWETGVAATGRADQYRGMLYIRDAGIDRDSQGRMIVPKQDFVADSGVKTTLGFGSGYARHPTLVTLFAFTNETMESSAVEPMAALLDVYRDVTEELVRQGRLFPESP